MGSRWPNVASRWPPSATGHPWTPPSFFPLSPPSPPSLARALLPSAFRRRAIPPSAHACRCYGEEGAPSLAYILHVCSPPPLVGVSPPGQAPPPKR